VNEQDWARSRPSNIQHGQQRPRPVSRSAILISLSVLVLALAVVVDGVWRMVAG
jgi:hypothetical protein